MISSLKYRFSKIIAFGNSYSDNGEANRISTRILNEHPDLKDVFVKPGNHEIYWNNRYSNGYTSVEVMATLFNVELLNYATGGATSGKENYTTWMDSLEKTGVLGQIECFGKSLNSHTTDPAALYFIFLFENDYFKFVDLHLSKTISELCEESLKNLSYGIEMLHSYGAKKFMIVNCSDLTLVPYEKMMDRTHIAEEYMRGINQKLPDIVEQLISNLSISIMIYDHVKMSDLIRKFPKKYEIVEFEKAYCCTYPEIKIQNNNPNNYYFWDEWHFSKATHLLYGTDMHNKVSAYDWIKR